MRVNTARTCPPSISPKTLQCYSKLIKLVIYFIEQLKKGKQSSHSLTLKSNEVLFSSWRTQIILYPKKQKKWQIQSYLSLKNMKQFMNKLAYIFIMGHVSLDEDSQTGICSNMI